MSEDTVNAAIAAKWETAGLDASNDDTDLPDGGGEDEITPVEDGETEEAPVVEEETAVEDETAGETATTEETEAAVEETVEAPAATTKEEKQEIKEAEDDLAEALGLGKPPADPQKRKAWWKSRVPYSQLHKVVTEREKKLTDSHTGVVKGYTDQITERDGRFADVKKVEDIIKDKPEQYVRTLAEIFPDTYGKMFMPILSSGAKGEAAALLEVVDPGPKPEADLKLPNGDMTYGVEGYQKLMDWQQKVTEQNMLKRFQPHLDFVKSQQDAAAKKQKDDLAEQHRQKGIETSQKMITEVETWDLGKDNIDEILAVAAKLDPTYDAALAMNIAYRQVVLPKLKANRDAMQADILKSMKKASAKSTAAGLTQTRTAATTAVDPATVDLDTRIKNAWKRKGLI
jgi:hypothetical protein